jgi:carbonic anhydrase
MSGIKGAEPKSGVIETLMERNRTFASEGHKVHPLWPRLNACVVTCPDPRVDPAEVLGLELGDAGVVRAAGGRISPIVMQQLLFLAQAGAAGGQPQEELELILMGHTDCGMAHLVKADQRELLSAFLGCAADDLDAKAPDDPYRGVRVDIEELAANPLFSASLSVTGMVYDVATGLVEVVERRSPLRAGGQLRTRR